MNRKIDSASQRSEKERGDSLKAYYSDESYSVIHPRNPKTGTRMPRYTITKNKTGWQHETECHIEELADDLAKLDVRLLELENKINNLFNLHVAFMKIMATELASKQSIPK